MSWPEKSQPTVTPKGIRNIAPAHHIAAIKKSLKGTLRSQMVQIAPKLEQTIKVEESDKANTKMGTTPTLEIVFWDVQHGSATYIKTPNGRHIIKDLGIGSYTNNDQKFSPLLHLKNKWRVKQLDSVIISHPHKDHIEDIINFDELSPISLFRPKHLPKDEVMKKVQENDKYLFDKYFEIIKRYSKPASPDNKLSLPENYGGIQIQKFTPRLSNPTNLNNHSIVTIISYADSKIILTGDNEPPSWNKLLEKREFKNAIKDADILLAPHHGRLSGFYPEIFKYFHPKLTIISDGRFCDTSATDRYSKISNGWLVHRRKGEDETRKCVTTRNDGVVEVKLGYNCKEKPFIDVTIN